MEKRLFRILVGALALIIHASTTEARTIHVSPHGRDDNRGTADAPLATLHEAQAVARQADKAEPLVIAVAGGTYYLETPLTFTSDDAGAKDAPVTWKAVGDKPVRVVGGRPLTANWRKHTDTVWKTEVPGDTRIDQLFINKQRQTLARYPNHDPAERYFNGAAPTWERMKQWKNPETAYIHALHSAKWGGGHIRLQRDDDGQLVERMVSIDTTTQGNGATLNDNLRFAENVFEELDAPGEWFFDEKDRMLYYQPEAGVDPKSAMVEIVSNPHLICFEGAKDKSVRHIEINGFIMTGASLTWQKTTEHLPNGGDFVVHRGGAVVMRGSEDCTIRDCTFRELGGNAVFIDGYNRRTTVRGCFIHHIGASGISLCGAAETMRGDQFFTVTKERFRKGRLVRNKWAAPKGWFKLPEDLTAGPKTENYPADCLITDNLITVIGELEKQTAGILLSMTKDNIISHNTIYKLPRAGICLNDGSWGGHIIEHNDVYDTVRETADHGPFNSWGKDRYWIWANHSGHHDKNPDAKRYALIDAMTPTHIRHNRFAHPLRSTHSWGIDLDDGSTNYAIYNNLTLGCAVKLREGFYRTVENNVFVAAGQNAPGKHVCFPGNEDVYRKNIVVNFTGDCMWRGIHHDPLQMKQMDYNCYYTPGNSPRWLTDGRGKKRGNDLKAWQKEGMEAHSVIADPMFIDPENGDYRVKPNSPAIKLGFKNFAMDRFGVTSERLKALLPERDLAVYANKTEKAAQDGIFRDARRIAVLGGQMKNMTTDMEKSAVGIGKITGVLVMDAPKASLAYRSGLRVGDLIIACNGKAVHDYHDLLAVLKSSPGKRIELKLHDDAKRNIIKVTVPLKVKTEIPSKPDAGADKPNFLILIADDWSHPHAGVLGDASVKTPTFDRIAREGILFDHAFVSAPSCSPSRSAILAGQHHWRLQGAANLGGSLNADVPLITDLLGDSGYLIGKFGKGVWPSQHLYRKTRPLPDGHEKFADFLARRKAGQPFFYWYGGADPHRPYDERIGESEGINPSDIDLPPGLPDHPVVRADVGNYYGEVQRFDRECGRILQQLEARDALKDTVVIMTSDNGMPFPRCKATLYDMGTRVPLAIKWPNAIERGRRVSDFVGLQDLAPTLLELAGLRIPETMNARSFVDILRSKASGQIVPDRDHVLTGMERHVECNPQRALRTSRYLIIKNYYQDEWPVAPDSEYNYNIDPSPTKSYMMANRDEPAIRPLYQRAFEARPTIELYDLSTDPQQLTNVADVAGYASVRRKMEVRLKKELAETKDPRRDRAGEFFEKFRKRKEQR